MAYCATTQPPEIPRKDLGYEVGRKTIERILADHGIALAYSTTTSRSRPSTTFFVP
jgi:hypothetical protein